MIASGLHFGNNKITFSSKPIASTPFVLKLHRGIGGGYDAVEAHKRFSPVDNIKTYLPRGRFNNSSLGILYGLPKSSFSSCLAEASRILSTTSSPYWKLMGKNRVRKPTEDHFLHLCSKSSCAMVVISPPQTGRGSSILPPWKALLVNRQRIWHSLGPKINGHLQRVWTSSPQRLGKLSDYAQQ